MKNRFNNLSSKEWLPFQKSWFKFSNIKNLYRENVRFFMKFDEQENPPNLFYFGSNKKIIKKVAAAENANLFFQENIEKINNLQFIIIDLLDIITENTTVEEYKNLKNRIFDLLAKLQDKLTHRKFISIFIRNIERKDCYFPYAWELAKNLSLAFSIKDEKIGCIEKDEKQPEKNYFQTNESAFYSLYFRKDENSKKDFSIIDFNYFENNQQLPSKFNIKNRINSWYILKPKSRNKDEILHPAKFPEELIEIFLPFFTNEKSNIFDPMCGTGSAILSALQNERNGFGIEMSEFFCNIAQKRCNDFLNFDPSKNINLQFKILCKDARKIKKNDFPQFDYIFTSPPYWNMLNMKGAEGQARRKEKGLQLNYSDDEFDLGNIEDYQTFLNELVDIYFKIIKKLKPEGYFTIVVKNIKKKGRNYPFAWDLSHKLQKELILLPEVFWLQDDIRIAPYGYFNTWVSNTFHHYCLTFQKP